MIVKQKIYKRSSNYYLWCVCSYVWKEYMPEAVDMQEWRNFSAFG